MESVRFVPVGLFSSVMGIGGLALAWRRAAAHWGLPDVIWQVLAGAAAVVFLLVALLYAVKLTRFPAAARAEWAHPVKVAFVPTATVSLLVLAAVWRDLAPGAAATAWWIGAVGHLGLTVAVIVAWIHRTGIAIGHVTPAWFIPVVGNVVTPLSTPTVGSVELAWVSFGVGIVCWLALLPIVLARLIFADPLPPHLAPTIAVLIAPPAVSATSLLVLGGRDAALPVVLGLVGTALAFAVVAIGYVPALLRAPFGVPWWATTFPLAALAGALLALAGTVGGVGWNVLAGVVLGIATVVVIGVASRTVRAAVRRTLFVPD